MIQKHLAKYAVWYQKKVNWVGEQMTQGKYLQACVFGILLMVIGIPMLLIARLVWKEDKKEEQKNELT